MSVDLRSSPPDARLGTRRAILTLLIVASVTCFAGLGRQAITDSDEGFYAEAAREMVESGDWLTPHFNYEQRWQKPALYYWLTAALFAATGPSELAARWWSALAGLGLVLLTWQAARSTGRSPDAAWLAGAIVATSFGCFAMARLALPDLPLAFLITLTIWAAFDERWLLAGSAAGLGFLMKGPIALVVPAIVLLPAWWRERRLAALPWGRLAAAAAVCAAIALPWFVAMAAVHGPAYLESFFVGDNLERFATDRFNEPRPLWFYIPIVLGGMMPWSVYLALLPWSTVANALRSRALSAPDRRLLLWAFVPLLFFTLSIGKQPRYILPVLPPLAVLIAGAIVNHIRTRGGDRRLVAAATWLTALLHAVLAALLLRAEPLFVTVTPVLTYAAIGAIFGTAAALAWIAATRRWSLLPATMTISAALVLLSFQFGAVVGARPDPVEQMAALVRAHRTADEPIGTYQVFVRNLVFYTHLRQVDIVDDAHAIDFLRLPGRVLLAVRAEDLPRIEARAGFATTRLGAVSYLNTANVRLRTLIWPDPEEHLDRVLLVANRQTP